MRLNRTPPVGRDDSASSSTRKNTGSGLCAAAIFVVVSSVATAAWHNYGFLLAKLWPGTARAIARGMSKPVPVQMYRVLADVTPTRKGAKPFAIRVGTAYRYADGTIRTYLDAMGTTGTSFRMEPV